MWATKANYSIVKKGNMSIIYTTQNCKTFVNNPIITIRKVNNKM